MKEGLKTEERSRVLVLDDDENQLDTLSAILEEEGFEVLVSQTAMAGIERLGRGDVDVAIVDLRLPDADEVELLDSLAELADDVASIIHTGYSSFQTAKKAVNIGAFAYVEKAGDPSELLRQVHRAVRDRLVRRAGELEATVAERTRELRQSEQRYRSIIATALDGVGVCDTNGQILEVNDAFCQMTGYRRDELLQKHIWDIEAAESEDDVREHTQRIRVQGSDRFETKYRRKDGRLIDVDVAARVQDDDRMQIVGLFRDVTERNRTQEALLESEQRLSAAQRIAGMGDFTWDTETGAVAWSDALFDLLQYDKSERIDYTRVNRSIHHPDDLERVTRWLNECITNGTDQLTPNEYRLVCKDGSVIWVRTVGVIRQRQGRTPLVFGTVQDITERKNAEEELRKNERNLAEAQKLAHVGSWDWDVRTGEVEWSDEVYRIFGLDPEHFHPQIDSVMSRFHPDDRTRHQELIEHSIANREAISFDARIVLPDGELREVISIAQGQYDNQGNLTGMVGTVHDVTERKRAEREVRASEEKFRALFNQAGDYIYILDPTPEGPPVIVDVNEAACRIHRGTRDELIGQPITLSDIGSDEHQVREIQKRCMAGETVTFETIHRRRDGTTFPTEVSVRLVDVPDQPPLVLGIGRDLSERKLLEEQLRHTQKMEAVGQLAAGVAHEFNNLLFGILGSAELILATQEGELGEHLERPLRDIKKCGRRGAALTKQLLSFARKKKPEVSQLDINEVVGELDSVIQRMITETITLETDLAADLPPIEADRGEIEQAVINLARNARDAMPDGGTLTIRTARLQLDEDRVSAYPHARPGRYVRLSVADTGCGMPPETMKRIFEPFFTTKPVGKGTGLGLSTVFADVTKSGGIIEVESHEGKGTVFHTYLPSAEETMDADTEFAARSADAYPGGNETILVVDDDEVVLDSGAYILEMRGYAVIRALGAPQALEAASDHDGPIDLLLTDVTMPEMNGWELSQKLAKQRPDMKVIFMSGYAQDVLDAGASEGQYIEFLEKPPEGDALLQRIRKVLDASGNSTS